MGFGGSNFWSVFESLISGPVVIFTALWSALTGDLNETQIIPFDGPTPGTPDTGISRTGVGIVGIGNGTTGDVTGNLQFAQLNISGLLDSIGFEMFATGAGGLARTITTRVLQVANNVGGGIRGFMMSADSRVCWTNVTGGGGADAANGASVDTGITRLAAGSVAVGNGTASDTSGNISAKTHTVTASAGAPTSAGTAGTQGQIIAFGGFLYFCSVTGVAGSATWNKLTMSAV
jgi:hypothetical protein